MPFAFASEASGVTVEQVVTDDGLPVVGITITGLDAIGPSTITMWRSTDGNKRRAVRGWNRRVVYGADFGYDYEVPLGRVVTYTLEVNSGAVFPELMFHTVTVDSDVGYIQDPLLPLGAVAVSGDKSEHYLTGSAFQSLRYAVESTEVAILGSNEPVAMTGQRMAMSGVDMSMVTRAAEQASALRDLLAETPLVLVRPLPEWGPLPDLIYTVPQVIEEPIDVSWGGSFTRWNLVGSQVAPPSIQVLVSLWTYGEVEALWATYADAQAAATAYGATYLDEQRDPTMGV